MHGEERCVHLPSDFFNTNSSWLLIVKSTCFLLNNIAILTIGNSYRLNLLVFFKNFIFLVHVIQNGIKQSMILRRSSLED